MMHRLILVVAVIATALVPGVAGAFDGEKELYDAAATVYIDTLAPRGVACRLRLPYRALPATRPVEAAT